MKLFHKEIKRTVFILSFLYDGNKKLELCEKIMD